MSSAAASMPRQMPSFPVGRDAQTGELLSDATSCSMCRRQIINSGLKRVVIRQTPTEFQVVEVEEWIREDDSLPNLDELLEKQ